MMAAAAHFGPHERGEKEDETRLQERISVSRARWSAYGFRSERLVLRTDDLDHWLDRVEAGRPASVFTDDVEDTRNALQQIAESETEPARVVTLSWQRVPALGNELGLLVTALAKATLELYPSLYGLTQATRERWEESDLETAAHEITRRIPPVLGTACRQILAACHQGKAPNIKKLSNSEQVHQLALAIEPDRLLLLIAVHDAEASKVSLRALAQGAEWLATNTRSRVILVLPTALSNESELDHVTYTACLFSWPVEAEAPAPTLVRLGVPPDTKKYDPADAVVSVSPVPGRPHPGSEAEQLLYEHICSDAELSGLFYFNWPVSTRYDTRPIVDLFWEAGRLVVEIDGQDHCALGKFIRDRRRDFELFMSGSRVIRFTRFNVLESPDQVLKDLRDAVRYLGTPEKQA
jgi:very-short-patch-repair endonuclease